MPYGPKSIAKDLRPINVVRHVHDDTRMAPVTSSGRPGEGYYGNTPRDVSGNLSVLPQAQTVYYQAQVPDSASFVPIGYNNAVPGVAAWVQHVVPSQPSISPTVVSPMVVTSAGGFSYSPTSGAQSDPASEDGGDDSVSGRKVKFLCSFGGKILPRPSDSSLRYVGGQTRILSVRRDISFGELVQKMVDTYGQDVVIKYQLPDEELDALVSVACADDVENMMDEYEKLAERSPDGSAKLRIFLFSPSDVESSVHIGDRQDGGCKYVEAVNGVVDSLDGGHMVRNESIESAAVASQTSDISGSEEITNVPLDTSPRMVCVDPNPVLYTDLSGAPLSIPRVPSGPTTVLNTEQVVDRSAPFTVQQSQPAVTFPVSSQYVQAYPDPRHETYNRAAYMQLPTQMGYPGQILGPIGPMYAQQSIPVGGTGVPSQMFNPTAQMTMSPSFVSMKPPAVPVGVQSQQVHLDHYSAGSMLPQRVVQFTTDQGFSTPHTQVPTPVQGGMYNWNQISHLEPTTLLEDCLMCQKQLPHAHSDTVAQELKESCPSVSSDSISSYHSLRLDNRGRPLAKPVINDVEQSKVILPRGAPSPYGPFVANIPQACQVNPAQQFVAQPQVQIVQDTDQFARESSKEYYGANVAGGSPRDDSNSLVFDHLRQIDGRLGNLQIRPSEILSNEQNKAIGDIHQAATRENPSTMPVESYEVIEPPPISNPDFYPNPALGANQFVPNDATGQPIYLGECQDNILRSQPIVPGGIDTLDLLGNNLPSMLPSYGAGDEVSDNSASLFSNQDPWSLRHDTHFPPPKPSKIQIRKENPGPRDPLGENRVMNRSESPTGNGRDAPGDGSLEHAGNLNQEFSSNKGSEEEMIKQELQAVAEGVAASVLHSSGPSNPDLSVYGTDDTPSATPQNGDVQRANVEVQRKDKETKTKSPDKVNLGSAASDNAGRLQIIRNSDLEELRELGSGTFGTVYHGKWRGTDVAIKRISDRCFAAKPSEQERMRDDFWNEAVNLADLHHPNVVAFYGVVLDGPEGSVATVTEYMVNGSLRNALQKNERLLDKRKRLLIGMDAAFGMEYLHGKNIVHFDLKSDNLLVNLRDPHRPICKVGDLGLSKVKCQTLISGGVRGTLPWMAPELLNGSSSLVSEKVDVFSFGIVMWELLTGEEPYADLHYGAIIGGIVSNTLRPPVPDTCDPVWRSLMEKCWASEPSERPNFTEIANELRAMAAKQPSK